jgi:hypothetical protein
VFGVRSTVVVSNRVMLGLRSISTVLGCCSLLVLTIESLHDPSTTGPASVALLAATCVVPLAAAFLNTTLGSAPPAYVADALLPALAFYAATVAGSLVCGARGLNWLVASVIYFVIFSALGYGAGKLVRRKTHLG